MLNILAASPLLALFVIMAVGLALGKIRIFGVSLGAAAAMFVSLGLATANPDIQIPVFVYQFGLALFVYAIGIGFGASFVHEFKNRGWKLTVFMIGMLAILVGIGYVLIHAMGLNPETSIGAFAGSLSSTPGMAAAVDILGNPEPIVGYSLAYPGAVIGAIVVSAVGAAILKVDHKKDAADEGLAPAPLEWRGVHVTRDLNITVKQLPKLVGQPIVATRQINAPDDHSLISYGDRIEPGTTLLLNGTDDALNKAIELLGEPADVELTEDAGLLYTRVTVSNSSIAGRRIDNIDPLEHSFRIARVRKGDVDMVPTPSLVLDYSDRVRVVCAPEDLPAVKEYLGNSESALGNSDLLPMSIGLTLGMLIGLIPIPMPGGSNLLLGFGGGPIVVGLLLGYLNRTGPLHWQMPFHTRQTMSTLGLTLFLAGVGTSAGASFRDAITDPASLTLIAFGLAVTLSSAILIGIIGMTVFKLKWDEAMGVSAGMTTNPAVFTAINEQTGTELAARGYATVYPTTIIGKIVAVQVLLMFL